jgi:hypothetical protein
VLHPYMNSSKIFYVPAILSRNSRVSFSICVFTFLGELIVFILSCFLFHFLAFCYVSLPLKQICETCPTKFRDAAECLRATGPKTVKILKSAIPYFLSKATAGATRLLFSIIPVGTRSLYPAPFFASFKNQLMLPEIYLAAA